MTVEAYPLHWPAGRPRTEPHSREHARFDTSMARARDAVVLEIERLDRACIGKGESDEG